MNSGRIFRLGVTGTSGLRAVVGLAGLLALIGAVFLVTGLDDSNAAAFTVMLGAGVLMLSEASRTRLMIDEGQVYVRRFGFLGRLESRRLAALESVAFELSREGLEPQVVLSFAGERMLLGPWETGFRGSLERKCRDLVHHLEKARADLGGQGEPRGAAAPFGSQGPV